MPISMRLHSTSPQATARPSFTPTPSPFSLVIITSPDLAAPSSRQFDAELGAVRELFSQAGLRRLHLRKPGADPAHVAAYLARLDPEHRRRVVVHGAAVRGAPLARAVAPFVAAGELGGVHYREADRAESAAKGHAFLLDDGEDGDEGRRRSGVRLLRSSGYHSLEAVVAGGAADCEQQQQQQEASSAVTEEPWPPAVYLDYCFLSPVYDSISKVGYRSAGFLGEEQKGEEQRRSPSPLAAALARAPLPVLALGGVGPGKLRELRAAGFAGAAVLGAVWQAVEGPVEAYRALAREAEEA
jgi:thiamine-phosphate pyrophosphorylase